MALKKPEPATDITNVLTGRPARGILNRFIVGARADQCGSPRLPACHASSDPAQDDRREARLRRFFVVLVRPGPRLGRDMNAEDLTRTIAEESLALLRALSVPKQK